MSEIIGSFSSNRVRFGGLSLYKKVKAELITSNIIHDVIFCAFFVAVALSHPQVTELMAAQSRTGNECKGVILMCYSHKGASALFFDTCFSFRAWSFRVFFRRIILTWCGSDLSYASRSSCQANVSKKYNSQLSRYMPRHFEIRNSSWQNTSIWSHKDSTPITVWMSCVSHPHMHAEHYFHNKSLCSVRLSAFQSLLTEPCMFLSS